VCARLHECVLGLLETEAQKAARGFGPDLETKLKADIARALGLDSEGKRVFVIRKDFLDLIAAFGENADIFLPPPPPPPPPAPPPPRIPRDPPCGGGRRCLIP
jgi:hypothetical protein